MESIHGISADSGQLSGIVRGVLTRWRLKRALHGATIAVAASFLVLAATALAMHLLRYSDGAVFAGRAVAVVAIVALLVRFVVRPVLARPRDEQVALYIEEHEPTLEGAMITAVDVSASSGAAKLLSPAIGARVLRSAIERIRRLEDGRRVDAADIQRTSLTFAAVLAGAIALGILGPAAFRHSLRLMLVPWDTTEPASLFAITVKPGNATIAKGGDQLIAASLHGFETDRVDLLVRSADSSNWTRLAMAPDTTGHHNFRLFDVVARTEYAVEASGVRSPVYHLEVAALPYVK